MNFIKKWWYKNFKDPYTVACDICMFYGPNNKRERLERVNGLLNAKIFSAEWVRIHTNGQARILRGHHYWEDEKAGGDKITKAIILNTRGGRK